MREWERMPLPLGAVGALLRSSDAERLHRILTFMETTVSLALSYGLAVAYRSGRWSLPPTDLAAALDQSSLGSRAQLLQQLDCGWDLRTTNEGFRDVVRLALGPSQLPKRGEPSVAQALQAMVAARNQLAHPSIPNAIRPDAAGAVANGVVALARTNRWFGYRLLRADGFTALPDGRPGVIATSMTGLHPAPYRGHAPIFAPEVHSVGELFLFREDGGARELCLLSPFVVARGKHVYFLADYRRGRPVMWCASHDAPAADEAMVRAVEAVLGAAAPVFAPISRGVDQASERAPSGSAVEAGSTPIRSTRRRWAIGVVFVAVIAAVAGLTVARDETAEPLLLSPLDTSHDVPIQPLSSVPSSTATARSTMRHRRDGALWALFGLDARFGTLAPDIASSGRLGPVAPPQCANATWRVYELVDPNVPGATRVTLWIDDELGLVEVGATSDQTVAALSAWVEARLGPPTRQNRTHAAWCNGASAVSVAFAPELGRPLLRVIDDDLRARWGAKRQELCPPQDGRRKPHTPTCP